MRILVRSPNWIGDQILSYPFFHFLRQAHPNATIVAACVPWVEDLQFLDLVDEVVVLPRPLQRGFRHRFQILEQAGRMLRERGPWDLGIALPDSFSSAWVLYRAGARKRRGFASDGRSLLLNEVIAAPAGVSLHRAERYGALLQAKSGDARFVTPGGARFTDFWGLPPATDLDPGVAGVLGFGARFDAAKAWQPALAREAALEPPSAPYWVLAPGSVAESRRYPVLSYAALAREIARDTGMRGLVVGGPAEAPLAADLCSEPALGLEDWTARGPIPILHRVFAGARFTVSNDSGLAHVASLCGSPVQIIWGAGNPKITEPIGPGKIRVLFNPVDCWPCERNTCSQAGDRKLQCLRGLQPNAVWEEIRNGLRLEHANQG